MAKPCGLGTLGNEHIWSVWQSLNYVEKMFTLGHIDSASSNRKIVSVSFILRSSENKLRNPVQSRV